MNPYHINTSNYLDHAGAGDEPDPFRERDAWLLANEEGKDTFKRPSTWLSERNADLEARLQLAEERIYFLVSELAAANARLGITDYRTQP